MYVTNRAASRRAVPRGRWWCRCGRCASDIPRAVEISARFPAMHGGPVHIGDPRRSASPTRCTRLRRPVRIGPGEVPFFWACGVTPQAVALEARPALAIFQAPGHVHHRSARGDFDSQGGGA